MYKYRYIYGPVPSRRLGLSLGVSPIPDNHCTQSCIYCQLGRTRKLTDVREEYFPLEDMESELDHFLATPRSFDVVTIVGEGEPTLYLRLGELIRAIQKRTEKPVAVITNGSLLCHNEMREELSCADIVLPSVDAVTEKQYKYINRPCRHLSIESHLAGIQEFSKSYKGQLWLETMMIKGVNDRDEDLFALGKYLEGVSYDRLYINTPVRPPAESFVEEPDIERVTRAVEILGGIAINELTSEGFCSDIEDDFEAIQSIIRRHPMNQYEIRTFLKTRGSEDPEKILALMNENQDIHKIEYKNYVTYRLN
ncbi:radical SAM protein [Clostridia bacterium]|nr:radical SAM protein [Clostridia bacterium]